MAQSWLRKAIDKGCASWDRHLHKLLYMLFQSVPGMRAGDVSRSPLYIDSEFVAWKDLEMTLQKHLDHAPSVQDLRLKITLKYIKGFKSVFSSLLVSSTSSSLEANAVS
jgi:hypothetical protein